jgi:ribosomal protein L6P/L9E
VSNLVKILDQRKRIRILLDNKTIHVGGPLGLFSYQFAPFLAKDRRRYNRGGKSKRPAYFSLDPHFYIWAKQALRGSIVGYVNHFALNSHAFSVEWDEENNALQLDVGFSHFVKVLFPLSARAKIGKRVFSVYCNNKHWMSDTTTILKSIRWPDAYKGIGIILQGEKFKFKPGKQRQ